MYITTVETHNLIENSSEWVLWCDIRQGQPKRGVSCKAGCVFNYSEKVDPLVCFKADKYYNRVSDILKDLNINYAIIICQNDLSVYTNYDDALVDAIYEFWDYFKVLKVYKMQTTVTTHSKYYPDDFPLLDKELSDVSSVKLVKELFSIFTSCLRVTEEYDLVTGSHKYEDNKLLKMKPDISHREAALAALSSLEYSKILNRFKDSSFMKRSYTNDSYASTVTDTIENERNILNQLSSNAELAVKDGVFMDKVNDATSQGTFTSKSFLGNGVLNNSLMLIEGNAVSEFQKPSSHGDDTTLPSFTENSGKRFQESKDLELSRSSFVNVASTQDYDESMEMKLLLNDSSKQDVFESHEGSKLHGADILLNDSSKNELDDLLRDNLVNVSPSCERNKSQDASRQLGNAALEDQTRREIDFLLRDDLVNVSPSHEHSKTQDANLQLDNAALDDLTRRELDEISKRNFVRGAENIKMNTSQPTSTLKEHCVDSDLLDAESIEESDIEKIAKLTKVSEAFAKSQNKEYVTASVSKEIKESKVQPTFNSANNQLPIGKTYVPPSVNSKVMGDQSAASVLRDSTFKPPSYNSFLENERTQRAYTQHSNAATVVDAVNYVKAGVNKQAPSVVYREPSINKAYSKPFAEVSNNSFYTHHPNAPSYRISNTADGSIGSQRFPRGYHLNTSANMVSNFKNDLNRQASNLISTQQRYDNLEYAHNNYDRRNFTPSTIHEIPKVDYSSSAFSKNSTNFTNNLNIASTKECTPPINRGAKPKLDSARMENSQGNVSPIYRDSRQKIDTGYYRDLNPSKPENYRVNHDTGVRDAPLPRGLMNYGQTCFLNSLFQCLATLPGFVTNISKFTTALVKMSHYEDRVNLRDHGMSLLLNQYFTVAYIERLPSGDKNIYEVVITIISKLGFDMGQQDCHELFINLMGELYSEELLASSFIRTSIVSDFSIELKIIYKCVYCPKVLETTDKSNFITILPGGSEADVRTLIDKSLEKELVDDMKCSECGKLGFNKFTTIIKEPKYLLVHINRFSMYDSSKDSTCVFINQRMQLSKSVSRSRSKQIQYSFASAVYHSGETINCGHFISLIGKGDDMMFYSDENSYKSLEEIEGYNPLAYLIFYTKD